MKSDNVGVGNHLFVMDDFGVKGGICNHLIAIAADSSAELPVLNAINHGPLHAIFTVQSLSFCHGN